MSASPDSSVPSHGSRVVPEMVSVYVNSVGCWDYNVRRECGGFSSRNQEDSRSQEDGCPGYGPLNAVPESDMFQRST